MKQLEKLWNSHYAKCVIISYWFLGLCNNFAYVIMLSAAHDILALSENKTNSSTHQNNTTNKNNTYDCNDLSTGTILLADILPGIVIKLIAPFFVHKIKYHIRVIFVIIVNTSSFLLVALTPVSMQWLIFVGVMCASLSSSFGEITFLSLSTLYSHSLSITGWGSGTGAAGLIGSFGYAALTSIGVSPRTAILMMLFIPVLMAISYIMLPSIQFAKSRHKSDDDEDYKASDFEDTNEPLITNQETSPLINNRQEAFSEVFKRNLKIIQPLFKYMIPLFLVYFAEYFINQGLYELLYFKGAFIKDHKSQYRWYNVTYQLAVFISRSSIKFIKIRYLYVFAILQLLNVGLVLSHIFLQFIPSIWVVFAIILWEGLLGGGCYVNAFYRVASEIPKEVREFSIAIVSVADSFGIGLAGFTAIPVHNAICNYGNK